ncbi:unnamed protein product [Diamesa serratosioi]
MYHLYYNNFQDDTNLDETNSILSIPSVNSQTTASMSVNKYNFKIDETPLSCCASRLLQFLFLELKTEIKEFVPKDHKMITKILYEINHTLKRSNKLSRIGEGDEKHPFSLTNMKNQVIQTDLTCDQLEMIIQKSSNLDATLEAHNKLDANFRTLSEKLETDAGSLELANCNEEIAKLSKEMLSLKKTLIESSDDKDNLFFKKLEDKCIELKEEMRQLYNDLEPKNNNDLIKNLSETLIKSCDKINSLEVKCAETTKESLIQLFENVKLDFLLFSRQIQTEELSRDVKNINLAYLKEIKKLKCCHFHGDYEAPEPKKIYKKSEPLLKSNNDIMKEVAVHDDHHVQGFGASSITNNNEKSMEFVFNNDEIKLMSLLENAEFSKLYQN